MFRSIRPHLCKLLCALALLCAACLIRQHHPSSYFYTTMFFIPIAGIWICYECLRILLYIVRPKRLLSKLAGRTAPFLRKFKIRWGALTSRLFDILRTTVIYQKLEYLHLKDTSRITGYRDEQIKNRGLETSAEYELSPLKWRRCKTNAERVRVLYAKYIAKNRRQKKLFSYSDTPVELQHQWGHDVYNELLIPAYYDARYNEHCDISDQQMTQLLNAGQLPEQQHAKSAGMK